MQTKILFFTLLFSLYGMFLSSPASAQRWSDLEDALEGRELVLRPTFEGRRKVYLDMADDSVFALHRGNRLFPLRESETVRITDADPEDDHIELELRSTRLGRGRVDFYGQAPTAQDFERWLDEVFEVTTAEADFQRYIGNRQSQTLHIRVANHLPDAAYRQPFATEADALALGYHRHEAARDYLEHLANQGKKERTLYTYGKDLEQIEAFFGTGRKLTGILAPHVGKFFRSDALLKLPSGKERSQPTVEKTKRVLRMFLVWAHETDRIDKLPLPKGTAMGRNAKKEGVRQS